MVEVITDNGIAHYDKIMNDLSVLHTDLSEGKYGDAGEAAADLMI